MFYACENATTINIGNMDTSKVQEFKSMFQNCKKLTTIYASRDFDFTSLTDGSVMFTGSTKLVGGNGTRYSTAHVNQEYARLDVNGTPGYFTQYAG